MKRSLTIAATLLIVACSPAFKADDLDQVKQDIRAEFAKDARFEKVGDIELIRESDRKVTGFMRITPKITNTEITVPCSATLGDDGRYIWTCGR